MNVTKLKVGSGRHPGRKRIGYILQLAGPVGGYILQLAGPVGGYCESLMAIVLTVYQ